MDEKMVLSIIRSLPRKKIHLFEGEFVDILDLENIPDLDAIKKAKEEAELTAKVLAEEEEKAKIEAEKVAKADELAKLEADKILKEKEDKKAELLKQLEELED